MKHADQKSEHVLITHIVNPHQFYYKHANHIVNSEFSKFDFEIQLYGNELYAQKIHENGYVPVENELVIFFNLIFNKWIRGRVISVGQEATFWCIDNGIWEKLAAPHVLPLTAQFQKDMNLVHLGGLSLLPTEKTLNVETVEVETQLSREWDQKSVNLFKRIISTSKTILFAEHFELDDHKFGSLTVELKTAGKKEINQVLLEMNNAAHSDQYSEDELWQYVHEDRLQEQLCKSILDGASIRTVNADPMRASVQRAFVSSRENLTPSEYFDDSVSRQSSSDISTIMEPSEAKPKIEEERRQRPKHVDMSNCEGHDDGTASSPPQTVNSRSQSHSKFLTEESYLRVCQSNFEENGRPKPLRSTMTWINSMNKSNTLVTTSRSDLSCASSTTNLKNDGKSNQTQPTSSSSQNGSAPSRRKIFADLAKQVTDSTAKKSAAVVNPLFGIPAGYAKNNLNTFGGLNIK